jgi:hypothetical protein
MKNPHLLRQMKTFELVIDNSGCKNWFVIEPNHGLLSEAVLRDGFKPAAEGCLVWMKVFI